MAYPKIPQDIEKFKNYMEIDKETIDRRIDSLLNKDWMTKEHKDLMKRYFVHLKRSGKKHNSQKSYLQNLSLLLKHIPIMPENYTKKVIDDYLTFLDDNYKEKTIRERKLFLIYFLCWFHGKEKHEIDLLEDLRIRKSNGTKLPEELLMPNEINKLTQVAGNFRDKCIIMLLYELGARRGEFLQLKIKHIQLLEQDKSKFGFITIPMGKTTSRKVPIIFSLPHLINWLNAHPSREDPESPLFVTLGSYLGQALGNDGLKMILKKVFKIW